MAQFLHWQRKMKLVSALFFIFLVFSATAVLAAGPTMGNWFQLHASPFTGSDDTGDGGTGLPADYNYFYVGQTFTAGIQIKSENTNAANIWIDYDTNIFDASGLTTGTYFSSWSGQTIAGGRIKSTGFRLTGLSSGTSTNAGFGSVQFYAKKPTAFNYGIGAPAQLTINTGVIGNTTESNISYLGNDILQEVENFNVHVWADTIAPYAKNPSPAGGASGVSVSSLFTFDLHDSKNGAGDDTGVGAGVSTGMPHGALAVSDHVATTSYAVYLGFVCTGVWGSSPCAVTVTPPSLTGIAGDTRRWKYNNEYAVQVSGFRDLASGAQNQLGDANGPNIMATTTWTFTTENDTTKPLVAAESPVRASAGNSVSANLVIDITDKKNANTSGAGVATSTCRVNVQSATFPLTTYQEGSGGVSVNNIDYGVRFTIAHADFGQNETVTVSVYDCQDQAVPANTMVTDTYTFTTADTDMPYVDTKVPADDASMTANGTISFHLKDNGTGVDDNNSIIYVNGVYYTKTGGAGNVTTNGTRITYASSLKFDTSGGGNYGGDTTTYSCNGPKTDCAFTLDPQTPFNAGEGVPVIVYTRDLSGNLMERVVYTPVVEGGSCASGSGFCGANTSWNAGTGKCEGTGGGTGGGTGTCTPPVGGGSPAMNPTISPSTASAAQIDETSVLITWFSNIAGTSRVVYGTVSPKDYGTAPNYNYQYSTKTTDTNSTYHSVIVSGLKPGQVYYFRPVTKSGGNEFRGDEMAMAPKFATTKTCPLPPAPKPCPACPTCKTCATCPAAKPCPTCAVCKTGATCPACKTCPTCPACPLCVSPQIKITPITPVAPQPQPPAVTTPAAPKTTSAFDQLKARALELLKISNINIQRSSQTNLPVIKIQGTGTPQGSIKLIIY